VLDDGVIHVWRIGTGVPGPVLAELRELLSGEEQLRAGPDLRAPGKARFVAGRAALRLILASYLGAEPASLRFADGAQGKPRLDGDAAGTVLDFSHARSGELALVAVAARAAPVGVDVEYIHPRRPAERLARRWLAAAETAALMGLAPAQRPRAFHRCWAAKEACLKGLGRGLGLGLGRFSVASAIARYGQHAVEQPGGPLAGWTVQAAEEPGGYVAAVAAPGDTWRVERRTLDLAGTVPHG
jgi:4'-phosphopantetheinyl transferase